MGQVKQILVVDDHFEMLEFLRSMLELADQEYQVLGVPSAEEAYLELRRMPYHLLITDLRLPGMSGFELVRKVQKLWPAMPVVMITAYGTVEGRREAAELGIHGYFEKPLDADMLLANVRSALKRGEEAVTGPLPAEPAGPTLPITEPAKQRPQDTLSNDIDRTLQNLLADTGAAQVVLASLMGDVLYVTGAQSKIDVLKLARTVAAGLDNSFALSAELNSEQPFSIQYQAGRRYDLYTANVGRSYFLMLIVDGRVRRGRIGTVWVFTQRAIKQLGALLQEVSPSPPAAPQTEPTLPVPSKTTRPEPVSQARPVPSPPVSPEPIPLPATADKETEHSLLDLLVQAEAPADEDLDAFWDDLVTNTPAASTGEGLSLEEARERGLIPPKFGKGPGD